MRCYTHSYSRGRGYVWKAAIGHFMALRSWVDIRQIARVGQTPPTWCPAQKLIVDVLISFQTSWLITQPTSLSPQPP